MLEDKSWSGTLKLIFQPGEEGSRGARPMVAAGVVDDVDYFFVGHLGCLLPSGQVASEAVGFFSSVRFDVVFRGKAAHAAMGPHNGSNALLAGASAALAMHGIARHGDTATFVNVGQMNAGTARNIVADHCVLACDVRGLTQEAFDYMYESARRVALGAAQMYGVDCEIVEGARGASNTNSRAAAEIVGSAAASAPGVSSVVPEWPIGGGDDAVYLIKRVQENGGVGGYFMIGSDIKAIHHAENFDIDERALVNGVDVFVNIARHVLADSR